MNTGKQGNVLAYFIHGFVVMVKMILHFVNAKNQMQ
jgi:hypothetical protein